MMSVQWCQCNDVSAMMSAQWCQCNDVSAMMSAQWCHCNDVSAMMSAQWCHCNDVSAMMSLQWCQCNDVSTMMSVQWCHWACNIKLYIQHIQLASFPGLPSSHCPVFDCLQHAKTEGEGLVHIMMSMMSVPTYTVDRQKGEGVINWKLSLVVQDEGRHPHKMCSFNWWPLPSSVYT